ncbi:AraC family transcriptional regulator [Sessilibacter corallicola]|uniref:AraC family transcriptional regulator n=1 Tax=Sessilibacter corallicola TaxID=2904075 RepID=A0ABQ0ABM9_9GAMM|nr:AraC family transcriptional regulator [Sessilibacter corallicola]MCE2027976.1 AraC family transcriptional regulator [Sessilibacter corallicola]
MSAASVSVINRSRQFASAILLGASLLLGTSSATFAQDSENSQSVSDQIEDLKKQVLSLNRDLLILEEELLYPANSQVAVYLSMDVGEFFELDAVKVHIDDKLVASELYTEHQVDALFRGGVQRLYLGNLKTGDHRLTAFFTGIGPQGREYKRAAEVSINKETEGKVYELKIVDSTVKLQPVFEIKEWQL